MATFHCAVRKRNHQQTSLSGAGPLYSNFSELMSLFRLKTVTSSRRAEADGLIRYNSCIIRPAPTASSDHIYHGITLVMQIKLNVGGSSVSLRLILPNLTRALPGSETAALVLPMHAGIRTLRLYIAVVTAYIARLAKLVVILDTEWYNATMRLRCFSSRQLSVQPFNFKLPRRR